MLAAVVVLAAATPAAAQTPPPWLKVEDGVTKAQFSLENAIEQTVFVETPLDTDADGRRDRVRIRISRPGETASRGIDVPVIFEHSPYRGKPVDASNHPVNVKRLPQGGPRAAGLRGALDDYYVPRGYAVVLGESIGTSHSGGCPDVGGPAETLGTKAVIDWLNGRAPGFGVDGRPVAADWTTGDVGMTGASYNGTLANQVATTGVEGLRTIIPVSAISSWYDYYRANGLVVAPHSAENGEELNFYLGEDMDVLGDVIGGARMAGRCAAARRFLLANQDRVTGDSSPFWRARDYLHRTKSVRASVFAVHGLNDFNVRTKQFADWWQRLRVPRKLWLHNGGHGGPRGAAYRRAENRWFDRWLFGVRNKVVAEPRVHIQREGGRYRDEADWPAPGTRTRTLRLAATSATAPGTLTTGRGRGPDQSFVDRGRKRDTDDDLITDPDTADPNRLVYRTAPLTRPVRLSGTPRVALRMSIDNRDAANLTAVLVDYGPAPEMITRGWLDPQNRKGIARSVPVRPGREYRFRWDLQPDDHVFAAGHRIGLVVVSTDHDYTLRPRPGTRLTLDPGASRLRLPIVRSTISVRGG